MLQVHMTEEEVANDFAAALEKVLIMLHHNFKALAQQSVAALRPAAPPRRNISECIAMLSPDSTATIDTDFATDVEAAIVAHREPLEPPAWD